MGCYLDDRTIVCQLQLHVTTSDLCSAVSGAWRGCLYSLHCCQQTGKFKLISKCYLGIFVELGALLEVGIKTYY